MAEHQGVARRDLYRGLLKPPGHAVMHEPDTAFGDEARGRGACFHEPRAKEPDVDPLPLAQDGPPLRRRDGALVGGNRLARAEKALSSGARALPLRRGFARRQRFGAPSSPGAC